jgi:hypothetical protein
MRTAAKGPVTLCSVRATYYRDQVGDLPDALNAEESGGGW